MSEGASLLQQARATTCTKGVMAEKLGVNYATLKRYEEDPGKVSLRTLACMYHELNPQGKAIIEKMVNEFFLA